MVLVRNKDATFKDFFITNDKYVEEGRERKAKDYKMHNQIVRCTLRNFKEYEHTCKHCGEYIPSDDFEDK